MKNYFLLIIILLTMIVTACLGVWQVMRHYEKSDINTKLAKLFDNAQILPKNINVQEDIYKNYKTSGKFDFSKQIAIGPRSFNEQIGRFIYTIFYTADKRTILVNRGFVSEEKINKINFVGLSELQNINIILMPSKKKKWFIPENNPEENSWIYVDAEDIGDYFDIELSDFYFNLISKTEISDGVKYLKSKDDYKLFDGHYKYAVFWFLMSITLLVMTLIFYKKNFN